jgi:hypothetical protein
VLDLVPLAGAGRQVADLDVKAEFVCQLLQFAFPQPYPRAVAAAAISNRVALLQRRVCELSVPLLNRPEGDVRGIGFQTVRTYIAIGNSEARGAMLARTIFGVAENSQAYRGPRARHPPRIEAF